MGRMTEARKRARRKKQPEERVPPPAVAVSGAEPPAASRPRISLPPSGLAEDILPAPAADDTPPEPDTSRPRREASGHSHKVSLFAAPVEEQHEELEASEHLVTFLLGSEEYGVDVALVQEIIRVSVITPVPRAPEVIKGVINLRGRIIPVVDLKRKLELGSIDETGRKARIVVVRLGARLIGLLVDGASQVLKVPMTVIEPAPEEVVEIDTHFIRGVAKLEQRLIVLIELNEILAAELQATSGRSAAS